MTRKLIVSLLLLFGSAAAALPAPTAAPLPDENGTAPAVESPWFPGRQYAFVWRNWTLVPARKLAEVLETPVENVRALAESMGLPPQRAIEPEWNSPQGYITVLRRNWHLLPYDQLLTLLGITREELAWRLIEDDYLFVKLGYRKPYCPPLHYEKPSESPRKSGISGRQPPLPRRPGSHSSTNFPEVINPPANDRNRQRPIPADRVSRCGSSTLTARRSAIR